METSFPAALRLPQHYRRMGIPHIRNLSTAVRMRKQQAERASRSVTASGAAETRSPGELGPRALKEWAVTCAALGNGEQTILLRKGGIREPTFRPAAAQFILLPTSFHSEANLLKPWAAAEYAEELLREPKEESSVRVEVIAEVTGMWGTSDPELLQALDPFHIWTPQYLDTRLRFRAEQKVTIMELRCRRLPEPLMIPNVPALWGCFSWATVPSTAAITAELWTKAVPAIQSDVQWAERQRALRSTLKDLSEELLDF